MWSACKIHHVKHDQFIRRECLYVGVEPTCPQSCQTKRDQLFPKSPLIFICCLFISLLSAVLTTRQVITLKKELEEKNSEKILLFHMTILSFLLLLWINTGPPQPKLPLNSLLSREEIILLRRALSFTLKKCFKS